MINGLIKSYPTFVIAGLVCFRFVLPWLVLILSAKALDAPWPRVASVMYKTR